MFTLFRIFHIFVTPIPEYLSQLEVTCSFKKGVLALLCYFNIIISAAQNGLTIRYVAVIPGRNISAN